MAQGTTKGVPIDIDGTLSNNSDLLVASQKATKTYVDNGLLLKQNVIGYTPVNKGGDTMLGNLILNANPTIALQAATKDYVDTLINGIDWKQAANAATVSSLPSYSVTGSGQILTGSANGAIPSATTDGVTLVSGNRVLVKNETSTLAPNNGIYVVTQAGDGSTPFILTRSADANTPSEIAEATLSISGGSTLSNSQWHCNPASVPVVIGTTNITFAQIGSGTYAAGSGLSLSGNIFSVATNGVTDAMIQSATNWNTAYTNRITSLTTTGSSGAATLTSNTLNIPNYTLAGLGGFSNPMTNLGDIIYGGTSGVATRLAGNITAVKSVLLSIGSGTSANAPLWGTLSASDVGAQASSTNLTSLAGLTYASDSFVKMTSTGTFTLDTSTYLTANQSITLSGDISGTGTTAIATTIGANKVTNAMLAQVATATFKGRVTAATGNVEDLTGTQATTLLDTFTSALKGLTPASGGGTTNFLRADGTWAAPSGGMAIGGSITSATAGSVLFAGASGVLQQDNTNFFWDDSNNRLGIGTATPSTDLEVSKSTNTTISALSSTTSSSASVSVKTGAIGALFRAYGSAFAVTSLASKAGFGPDGATGLVIFTNSTSASGGTGSLSIRGGGYDTAAECLVVDQTGTTFTKQLISTVANSTTTGGGQIYLNGTTGNRIDFNTNGVAAPAFTTRSAGTKIVLYPNIGATTVDLALGIEGGTLWMSTGDTTTGQFKWYAGTTNIMTLAGTGVLTVSANQNATTNITVSNTTSGTTSQSQLILTSDATAGSGNLSKKSNTFTTSGIINLADLVLQNSTKGDIAVLNSFATGAIKFAAGASTTAQLTLSSAGVLTQSVNQNAATNHIISNTTSGTASESKLTLTSDASSGSAIFGKYSTTTTTNKIITTGDAYIYNATSGDIAILNDFASGTIIMAAGASSTAHVTIGTTGLTTFATGVDYKRLNPTTTTVASTATLTPDISAGDTFTITAQAVGLSVANPTGTPVEGQKMIIRIKDNGTARAITWSGTQYRASTDLPLPTTTIISKTMYLGFIYNSTDTKWDLLAYLNNF